MARVQQKVGFEVVLTEEEFRTIQNFVNGCGSLEDNMEEWFSSDGEGYCLWDAADDVIEAIEYQIEEDEVSDDD